MGEVSCECVIFWTSLAKMPQVSDCTGAFLLRLELHIVPPYDYHSFGITFLSFPVSGKKISLPPAPPYISKFPVWPWHL